MAVSQVDTLKGLLTPVNEHLRTILATQLSPKAVGMLVGLVEVAEAALFVVALAWLCSRIAPRHGAGGDRSPQSRSWPLARLAAAALAGALLVTSVRFASPDLTSFFSRWDHLIFCAATGIALAGSGAATRRTVLTAVSLAFLVLHLGRQPILLVAGGGLAGLAALHLTRDASTRTAALVQAVVLLATASVCWFERSQNALLALRLQGAFGFFLLRHISFVVESRRGMASGPGDYLCYMFFYTSFIGACETFNEFATRNLSGGGQYDYRAAATKIVLGHLYLWASFQIEITFDSVMLIENTWLLWGSAVVLFIRSSLFVMGMWSGIEGVALLYGVVLRPNFTGVLTSENPAQFWRAWRGTMTNWLIRYIYIPLGGNRRHQPINILAAFGVSTAWHAMGIPFFTGNARPMDFASVVAWGALNASAVIGYSYFRGTGRHILPAATPLLPRRLAKLALTACFASFTVTLLDFRPKTTDLFIPFVLRLVGLQ